MRANTDRAPGVRLITDRPLAAPAPVIDTRVEAESIVFRPETLVALMGRVNSGFYVQLIADTATGETWLTCSINGETDTFPIPSDKALDAFEHPFAYGCNLPV